MPSLQHIVPREFRGSLVVLALSLLPAAPSAAATNIVVNPGFETGSLTGWTSNVADVADFAPYPHSGTYGAYAGPYGSVGFLSQNLPTVAGQTYQLSYWLLNQSSESTNQFQVSWNGGVIASQTLVNTTTFGYTLFSVSGLQATSASTTLSFGFRHDPSYWGLDDVSVVQTSSSPSTGVPDAGGTLCLFGMALAGLGFVRRWVG